MLVVVVAIDALIDEISLLLVVLDQVHEYSFSIIICHLTVDSFELDRILDLWVAVLFVNASAWSVLLDFPESETDPSVSVDNLVVDFVYLPLLYEMVPFVPGFPPEDDYWPGSDM